MKRESLPEVNSPRWMDEKDLPGENWAETLTSYGAGVYYVSNYGRVKRRPHVRKKEGRGRYISGGIMRMFMKDGYWRIRCTDGRMFYVHRLVASAFLSNPAGKPEVDHKNTIRSDNRVSNLRWATRKENLNNPVTSLKRKGMAIPDEETMSSLFPEEKKERANRNHKKRRGRVLTLNPLHIIAAGGGVFSVEE